MNLCTCATCTSYVAGLPIGTGFCNSPRAWKMAAVTMVYQDFGCVCHEAREAVVYTGPVEDPGWEGDEEGGKGTYRFDTERN